MKQITLLLLSVFFLSSCATIVNDPTVPVTFTFSDGSSGTCNLTNKRGAWSGKIPQTFKIRTRISWQCETVCIVRHCICLF